MMKILKYKFVKIGTILFTLYLTFFISLIIFTGNKNKIREKIVLSEKSNIFSNKTIKNTKIYYKPDIKSKILIKLKKGHLIKITGETKYFYKIDKIKNSDIKSGYILKEMVNKI